MNKVTVEQFLNAGFELAVGDVIGHLADDNYIVSILSYTLNDWNERSGVDGEYFIKSLAPRTNTGTQPVADDCVVEVTYDSGLIMTNTAGLINWKVSKPSRIVTWKPSLKHLEQQMNKQESAINISERDIEDAIDNVEVERVLTESDEWKHGDECLYFGNKCIYISQHPTIDYCAIVVDLRDDTAVSIDKEALSKPLTPEQLEAKERDDSVDTMLIDAGFRGNVNVNEFRLNNLDSDLNVVFDSMFNLYDAGYRK